MFTDKEEKYERQRLRMFWTYRWSYVPIDTIIEHLIIEGNMGTADGYSQNRRTKYLILLHDALIKMIFEKRLTRDEASSLFDMIKSTDKESLFLALTIMQQKKRTIFLKK